jgi:hypothetical protein
MGATHNFDHEYWRPAGQVAGAVDQSPVVRSQVEVCQRCNTEFVLGSRFCHVCGAARQAQAETKTSAGLRSFVQLLDFHVIKDALGLSIGSLVAFTVGMLCTVFAIGTGLVYTANTVLDWQAVQVWRIEWLLAGLVAFAAGILLKRAS